MPQTQLKRDIGLFALTFYGLGTILGAGIYVLIGKIAGISGVFSPLVFLVSAIIALFSAFSFAELSSIYPKSAGEAYYVDQAFRTPWLTKLVGFGVVLTGIVSAATLSSGFIGYTSVFIDLPQWLGKILILLLLTSITVIGIKPSISMAVIITIIEILGLIWVISINADITLSKLDLWTEQLSSFSIKNNFSPILIGAFLAFYAFIGFEDIVNVAEEVKQPERNLPLAIFISIAIATVLYFSVSLVSITAMSVEKMSQSEAPLAALVSSQGPTATKLMSIIGMVAVINGALVQIIMASRVIYGMAKMKSIYQAFAFVHPKTQTPITAIVFVAILVIILSLGLPLVTLAKITSFLILIIFLLVNVSLLILKIDHRIPSSAIKCPTWLPALSALLCLLLILTQVL